MSCSYLCCGLCCGLCYCYGECSTRLLCAVFCRARCGVSSWRSICVIDIVLRSVEVFMSIAKHEVIRRRGKSRSSANKNIVSALREPRRDGEVSRDDAIIYEYARICARESGRCATVTFFRTIYDAITAVRSVERNLGARRATVCAGTVISWSTCITVRGAIITLFRSVDYAVATDARRRHFN